MTHLQDKEKTISRSSGCPNLGTYSDKSTRYGYPSENNYCHRTEIIDTVRLNHQRSYCLTLRFEQCPVYLGRHKKKLPEKLRGEVTTLPISSKPRVWIITGIFVILLVVIFIFFQGKLVDFGTVGLNRSTSNSSILATEPFPGIPTSDTSTQTLTPTHTNLLEQVPNNTPASFTENTITQIPATTAVPDVSPTQGPGLETPFGPDKMYLIHKARAGESLPSLAERFRTSVDVIKKINRFDETFVLQLDQVILLIPGKFLLTEAEPLLPVFLEFETTISEISSQFGVTEEDVRYYNSLGKESEIPGGRWLVLPIRQVTATQTPILILTPDLGRALTVPFGPENVYVIHQVQPGESIALLENLYLTSEAVIRQTNDLVFGLQVGQVLVIQLNLVDPTGIAPLKPLLVEEEILIEDLALQLEVLLSELLYHNGLTIGMILLPGDWIVYPDNTN